MKTKHIKKETTQRLRDGFHTDLMELIDESIDLYTEKTFERGYKSFYGDVSVHAQRLADFLYKKSKEKGATATIIGDKDYIFVLDIVETAKVIEEYFNLLKTE